MSIAPFEFLSLMEHAELAEHVRIRGLRFLSASAEWVTTKVFENASDARWWITHDMPYPEMCHAVLIEDAQLQVECERRARIARQVEEGCQL